MKKWQWVALGVLGLLSLSGGCSIYRAEQCFKNGGTVVLDAYNTWTGVECRE